MRIIIFIVMFIAATSPLTHAATSVGFVTLNVPGVPTVVWYPTSASGPQRIGAGNSVFYGVPVVEGAPVQGNRHPVALLSHGYSGLWRNQAWLAARLAKAGYIAVAFNHPGTTFGDINPSWASHPANRPHQVSRVLDALLASKTFDTRINRHRITVIGHSLGGSTALFLAGAVFKPALLEKACTGNTHKIVCKVYRQGGLSAAKSSIAARDPRISSAVLLGMEGIRGFTRHSLEMLPIPVLALVSGVEDPALPLDWEGRAQAARLSAKTARYAEIIGATHFSFMSRCKPGAKKRLGHDAYVCEGETVPREELHQLIAQLVINFLNTDRQLVSALKTS